jgi:ABC-type nitrate/sulfonate/bicarbonate transport system substrate-binding protein
VSLPPPPRPRPRRGPLSAVAALLATLLLAGCGGAATSTGDGPETLKVRYQGSPNAVTFLELAADLGYLQPLTLDWVGNTTSGPQDIQSAATGQVDIGGAHGGAVAKLIQSGAPVKAVINYYGVDSQTFTGYYVPEDSPIHTARDLIGKKIGVNTLGAHHEAVIDTWLKQNGLTPDEIKQVQLVVVPPINTEEGLRHGQLDAGALGGVLQDHALSVGGVRALFTDRQVLGDNNSGQLVIRDDFLKKNPKTSEILVTGIGKAIEWARVTPREQVIDRFTKIIEQRGRNESTANLKFWKSVSVPARGGLISDADFKTWEPWLLDSGAISGPLDITTLYTNEFNDYRDGRTPAGAPGGTA